MSLWKSIHISEKVQKKMINVNRVIGVTVMTMAIPKEVTPELRCLL